MIFTSGFRHYFTVIMQTMGLSLTRAMPVAHKMTDMVLWPYERLSRVVHLTKNGVNCEIEIERII